VHCEAALTSLHYIANYEKDSEKVCTDYFLPFPATTLRRTLRVQVVASPPTTATQQRAQRTAGIFTLNTMASKPICLPSNECKIHKGSKPTLHFPLAITTAAPVLTPNKIYHNRCAYRSTMDSFPLLSPLRSKDAGFLMMLSQWNTPTGQIKPAIFLPSSWRPI
jgi:hypothetical protein